MANLRRNSDFMEVAPETMAKRHLPESASAYNGKVLIVEDEPEILEPLAHSLQKAGFTVLRAENGLTACRIIGSEQPDLVLLDILLPDLNGWEVCRLLRQHPDPTIACTPVIMLTALTAPEDKFRGLEIGADQFLPKPYSIREVILLSDKLIKKHQKTINLEGRLTKLTAKEKQEKELQSMLFHELRNQLTILGGYSELLHKRPEGKHADTCRDAILHSSNYLQSLADEVMLIRQLEDGALALPQETLNITEIIREIIQVYLVTAREKCIQLSEELAPLQKPVILNRPALKIILSSLLDNSIKYGAAGQTVTVSCRQDQDSLEILVSDQGPGIPPEALEQIFDSYFRVAQQAAITGGAGLGLHAVRILSRAMGGDVYAENNGGQGCRFRVTLPNLFHTPPTEITNEP